MLGSGRLDGVNFSPAGEEFRPLRHIAVAGRLCRSGTVLDAGLRTSATDQRVFDDLVELGLAGGRITGPILRGLVRGLAGTPRSRTTHPEETACES